PPRPSLRKGRPLTVIFLGKDPAPVRRTGTSRGCATQMPRSAQLRLAHGHFHRRYHRHMQDVWIALDARARRVNWLWTGLLSLVFAGLAAAIYVPERGDPHPSATERWWWFGVVGACWLASCIYLVNRGYGSTKLSHDGMQLRSFFTHRFIAWRDIR